MLGPWRLSAGPTAQHYDASAAQNGDRLLATYAAQYHEEEVFRPQAYGG
jgi:hypothetical protein